VLASLAPPLLNPTRARSLTFKTLKALLADLSEQTIALRNAKERVVIEAAMREAVFACAGDAAMKAEIALPVVRDAIEAAFDMRERAVKETAAEIVGEVLGGAVAAVEDRNWAVGQIVGDVVGGVVDEAEEKKEREEKERLALEDSLSVSSGELSSLELTARSPLAGAEGSEPEAAAEPDR
jgi:hypothetical protein